jgi:hypothetical protein
MPRRTQHSFVGMMVLPNQLLLKQWMVGIVGQDGGF